MEISTLSNLVALALTIYGRTFDSSVGISEREFAELVDLIHEKLTPMQETQPDPDKTTKTTEDQILSFHLGARLFLAAISSSGSDNITQCVCSFIHVLFFHYMFTRQLDQNFKNENF